MTDEQRLLLVIVLSGIVLVLITATVIYISIKSKDKAMVIWSFVALVLIGLFISVWTVRYNSGQLGFSSLKDLYKIEKETREYNEMMQNE